MITEGQRPSSHAGALSSELWPQIVDMTLIIININQPNYYTSIKERTITAFSSLRSRRGKESKAIRMT